MTPAQRVVFDSFVKKSDGQDFYAYPPPTLMLSLARIYLQNYCDTIGRRSYELMDHHIENIALLKQKKVLSLDGNQSIIVSSLSDNDYDSINNCISLISKILADDASDCEIIQSYKRLEIDYNFKYKLLGGENNVFIVNRNTEWLKVLDKAFKTANCFVAVGYKHLMYQQGLVRGLMALGYTVKPIAAK